MDKIKKIIALVFILTGPCLSAQTFDEKLEQIYEGSVPFIRTLDLRLKMQKSRPVILDTRSKQEFEVSHLPGARFVDYDRFNASVVSQLNKEDEIVVYCTVGYRSERIGEKLRELGFKKVTNLYGGIIQWANEKGDLVNKKGMPTDSIHTYSKKWSQWLVNGIGVH
jgi:rhodanese-related sulfurtransferase